MRFLKHIPPVLPSACAVLCVLASACSRGTTEPAAEKPSESASPASNHAGVVKLPAAVQQAIGLQTAALMMTNVTPEAKGYGRVLDVSPLVALTAELVATRAAGEASQAEVARLRSLAQQANASQRALQAAEANFARDQAQFESVRLRLMATWGSAVSERKDLHQFVQELAALKQALVRLDFPPGELPATFPTHARLIEIGHEDAPIQATFFGPAPSVDSAMQGKALLFLVSPNTSSLTPGAALTGFVPLPGTSEPGVLVPRSAIIRFSGLTWVYLREADGTFKRLAVNLDQALPNGWFVRNDLKADQTVVITGAQGLLSEELKGQLEE